jgi:hypothetical protein
MGWPPLELRAAVRRLELPCPDCPALAFVRWSARWECWVITVAAPPHAPGCPTRRSSRSLRACEQDMTAMLGAALRMARYAPAGDLIEFRHRVAA